jgi:hypothetical protein
LCQDNLAYATKTRAEINSLIDWLKQINNWEKPEDKAIAIRVKLERMGAIAKAEGK